MVSACPRIYNFSRPLNKHLQILPSALITTGISVTLMFPSFSSSLARSNHLSLFSFSLIFILWSTSTTKPTIQQVLVSFFFFFFFCQILLGLVFCPRLDNLYLKIPDNYHYYDYYYCYILLYNKQGRTHKWYTLMDPHIWPSKGRTTSTNIHSAAVWG